MNAKLYVGNLSVLTTEDGLWNLFSRAGTVISIDLIRDRLSRRSNGFAFIVMSNLAEAEQAIEVFDDSSLDGNQIRVSFARRRDNQGVFSDHER